MYFADDYGEDDKNPWASHRSEKKQIWFEQKEMPEFDLRRLQQSYLVHDGLFYTTQAPAGKAEYPCLVLPPCTQFCVIRRTPTEIGHYGIHKTLDRDQEA